MTDHELLLLNIANAALGIVSLVFFVMVGWATLTEVAERVRARWAATANDHAFAVPELGMTMADGGEKVDDDAGTDTKTT